MSATLAHTNLPLPLPLVEPIQKIKSLTEKGGKSLQSFLSCRCINFGVIAVLKGQGRQPMGTPQRVRARANPCIHQLRGYPLPQKKNAYISHSFGISCNTWACVKSSFCSNARQQRRKQQPRPGRIWQWPGADVPGLALPIVVGSKSERAARSAVI